MSDLPAGWTWTTVDDLSASIQYGYTESANDKPVGPKFLRITDIQGGKVNWDTVPYCECSDDDLKKYLLESGDIVFARTGATTGKSFLITAPPKAVFASYLIRLRLQKEVDRKYFSFFLNSPNYWSQITRVSKGSAQPGVNATILSELQVPLAPQDEQKRIAEKLDSLLTRVDSCQSHLERVPQILKRFRQSVLAAATSGRLTEEWREKNSKHNGKTAKQQVAEILADREKKTKKPPESHLVDEEFDIPEGWLWVSLDSLSSQIVDGTHFTPKYLKEGVPFISVKDIQNGKIDFSDTKFISKSEHLELSKRCKPEIGDLLITKSGTIGRMAMVNTDIEFSLFVSVALLKPASKLVNMRFIEIGLENWINSIDVSSRIVGSTIKNLHIRDMRVLAIPFPSLEEQAEIVRRVESLFAYAERLEARYLSASERVERLTPSLLAKAFRGELVEQDQG